MEISKIKRGSMVYLNSGGPAMIVFNVNRKKNVVSAAWPNGESRGTAFFCSEALRETKPEFAR